MSNNDFEVHPRGTMEELKVLRQFVKDISNTIIVTDCGDSLKTAVAKINIWYTGHNERYPNV